MNLRFCCSSVGELDHCGAVCGRVPGAPFKLRRFAGVEPAAEILSERSESKDL